MNGHAMAHGGLIFALADTAFACACNSFGPVTVAASAEIVFVAPRAPGTCWWPRRCCGPGSAGPGSTT